MGTQDQEVVFRLSAKNLTSAEFAKARRDLIGVGDAGKKAQMAMTPLGGAVRNASGELARMNPATARLSGLMGGASVATLGAVGAIGALAGAASAGIGHVIRLGDEVTTLSSKTGLSTDFLQELSHAADTLDVPFNSAASAVSKLQTNIGKVKPSSETLDALRSMGLSVEELKALAPEEQFLRVADSLSRVSDQSQLAATAQALFGRGGIELIPLLKGNYRELASEAHNLGLVIDQDLLEAGDDLGENWNLLLKRSSTLLGKGVNPLVRGLNELLEVVNSPADDRGFLSKLATTPLALIAKALPNEARDRKKAFDEDVARALKIEGELSEAASRNAAAQRERAQALEDAFAKLKSFNQLLQEGALAHRAMAEAALQHAVNEAALADVLQISPGTDRTDFRGGVPGILGSGAPVGGLDEVVGSLVPEATEGVGDLVALTEKWKESQDRYNDALAAANDIAQLFEGNIGDVIGQTLGAVASLQNLSNLGGEGGIFGGLKGAFSQGQGGQGGILGFLGGVGGVLSAAGPLVGFGISAGKAILRGIKSIFGGRDGEDAAKEIARDLGATVSQELADAIAKSGRPVQLAIADIFREGGFRDNLDRFPEEIADLFSFFERGEISKPELIAALEESLPLLIENLEELGPEGEEQFERIIGAAKRFGVDLEALGFDLEALKAKMDESFAPQTLEEMAETLDLTKDEIRALGEELGINIQTNLERMAASVNLSVQEFEALRTAAAAALGKETISAEEFLKFLEATGLTAEKLAEELGVEVSDGAGTAADEASRAADETSRAADEAGRLADNYERAGRAVGGIGFNGGFNDFPITGAANEFEGRVTGPRGFFIEPGVTEDVSIHRPGNGGDRGGTMTFHTTLSVHVTSPLGTADEIADAIAEPVKRILEDNVAGVQAAISRSR